MTLKLTFGDSFQLFTCMRQFLIPLLRRSYSGRLPQTAVQLGGNPKACKRDFSTGAHFSIADMGKEKVQFQLKTPKGTKDCKSWEECCT